MSAFEASIEFSEGTGRFRAAAVPFPGVHSSLAPLSLQSGTAGVPDWSSKIYWLNVVSKYVIIKIERESFCLAEYVYLFELFRSEIIVMCCIQSQQFVQQNGVFGLTTQGACFKRREGFGCNYSGSNHFNKDCERGGKADYVEQFGYLFAFGLFG